MGRWKKAQRRPPEPAANRKSAASSVTQGSSDPNLKRSSPGTSHRRANSSGSAAPVSGSR